MYAYICLCVHSAYIFMFFFFNDTATTEIYTLSLHDALPISYWVNFASTGDPNGKGLAKWPVYDEKTRTPMVFGNKPEGAQAPSEDRLAFFQSYFEKLTGK